VPETAPADDAPSSGAVPNGAPSGGAASAGSASDGAGGPGGPAGPGGLRVHKFGGAALADADAFRHAARIVAGAHGPAGAPPALVVASAVRGATDALLGVARAAAAGDSGAAAEGARALRARHEALAAALAPGRLPAPAADPLASAVAAAFDDVDRVADALAAVRELTPAVADRVAAHGEDLAARLLAAALRAAGVDAEYVDARAVVHAEYVDGRGRVHADARPGGAAPDLARTAAAAAAVLGPLLARGTVPVVPGFVARAPGGATVTLGRGGSDLTATLLAAALGARDVVLWKDVPGFLTADPRVVPGARLVPALHAREAAELAYHGARVLHPRALVPLGARPGDPPGGPSGGGRSGAPPRPRLFVRPLADPAAPGTEILVGAPPAPGGATVKALAAAGDQALVTVAGTGMLGAPGFAARAFAALDAAAVPVSLISQASSEQSLCVAVPAAAAGAAERALAAAFAPELARREVERVAVRPGVATVAVVGLGMAGTPGVAGRLFEALGAAGVNVVAIAQGAAELNVSVVVDAADAGRAQRAIHDAFRLDKVGGGSPDVFRAAAPADVVLLGFGHVGRAVARQLAAAGPAAGPRPARLVAVVDRSGYVFDPGGLSAGRVAALARAKAAGAPLADGPHGLPAAADAALAAIARHALSRPVLVDVTAGDTGLVLEAAVRHGMDLVLANKRPLADGPEAAAGDLARAAVAHGRRVRHEATVGAGLPLLDTLQKLRESGDRVLRVEGCPSGTLGYLFGELGRGVAFSDALGQAVALGYTEPDPRDDLSGADVARKAVILARLLGWRGELAGVRVASLVPAALRAVPRDAFVARVVGGRALDAAWARRVAAARARGRVLRYRVAVGERHVRVGLAAVAAGDALAALSGTDNQFSITTRRYREHPLVITGPGAGADVTAAGVVNDVLALAATR
jgi:aspartokinase/homoserine dehydrogenase 1